jgi:sarcosine oxidase, subunit alpha
MNRRLAPQPGEWIDRSRPVPFQFEGQSHQGYQGDVLSSALWANDVRMTGRSFKYHRARGPYSLANCEVNVMVEDGQHTNMRGDSLPIVAGMNVRAVNTVGGLAADRLRITERFSKFMPVGFYYKAFHTPRRLFPFYENQMRKVAGLGRINAKNVAEASPKDYAFCDLCVIGAGPAGLSGAIAAAEQGLQVLVVEELAKPGGSLAWQCGGEPGSREKLAGLLARAAALPNLEIRCSTQAAGWYSDHWIGLIDEQRLTKLRARALLAASGCYEQPAVFGYNDLPGIMLGSAAQRLIRLYAVKPFDRCVVLAANSDAYRMAMDLHGAGVDVAAIVDIRTTAETSPWKQAVDRAKIRVLQGHTIYEAKPDASKTRVGKAIICPLDSRGEANTETAQTIECDGIAVSVGWCPTSDLLYQAGARFTYDEQLEQLVPKTLPATVFAAGRVNGVFDLDAQLTDGRRAGLAAAKQLGRYDGSLPEVPAHRNGSPSHPYPIFSHPKRKNFVELDEDLHLADFVNAHQEGYDNIELLKRYTTVGMGPSQGKLANMNAVRILARLNGKSINETGTTTSRPFHHPVSFGHLAGRRFHPLRRTPMHDWHEAMEAKFVHVGVWHRPEYYADGGKSREDCIINEAKNVRGNVGLIDLSTLGKIEICGPDAAAFLDRVYTGRFSNLKIGKTRYGIACDESGVIYDEGVVVRVAEDRFYVTATTSGSAVFYRELQRWALIWKMKVTLINLTGQIAAMNLAGPKSKEILEKLTDTPLGSDQFAFLESRQGVVAGVHALLMRVGFVGELGYEIHVPTGYALHVWSALMEAGKHVGIKPFGVEAQRLLRLEKGHLIVSQDTDALTTPYEADLTWAVREDKPFFLGQRSLTVAKKQPLTRRLVGIKFKSDYQGPLPEECHLIIHQNEIVGRVTSIAHRSTLGHALGMAFLRPDLAGPGNTVQIRVDKGRIATAEVATLPFYDPDNRRQK